MRWRERKVPSDVTIDENETRRKAGFRCGVACGATIAPMPILLPPSLQADFLALRRAGWEVCLQPLAAPVLLVAACVALAGVALYTEYAWCVGLSGMLALAGSFTLTRDRLMTALLRSRFGWCGALPVPPRNVLAALSWLAVATLVVAMVVGGLLLLAVAAKAPHPDALNLALLALDGGLTLGVVAATVVALRKGAVERSRHVDGIREPLFALAWLNDARLPHLSDWQRRAAVVGWRRGGSFVMIGCALAAVPDGAAIPAVAGMVLWMLALVWFEVVMRASAAAVRDARRLLGALPLRLRCMRRAALRYPLFAATCAMALVVFGVAFPGGGFLSVVGWIACALAGAVLPLRRIVKVTRAGDQA